MEAYVKGTGNPEPSIRPFYEEILLKVHQHSLESPSRAAFFVVSMEDYANHANQLPIYNFQDILKTDPNLIGPLPKVDINKDTAILPSSSGTTGLPKMVKLSHKNLTSLLHTYTWYGKNMLYPHLDAQFDPTQECFLHFLPHYHMFGFSMLLIALAHGFTGILMERYQPELLLQCVKHLHIVPPVALYLAKSPLVNKKYDLSSLRSIYVGAAALGPKLATDLKERLNLKSVTQGYGCTEATLSFFRPTYKDDPPLSSGKLQGHMEAKLSRFIADIETGKTLKVNKVGELCVKGELVMLGYLNNEKATREVLSQDGWVRTGDIGYLNSDGYLFIVDRLKELIRVSGRQVAPNEIEDILQSHPKISDAAVVGVPDNKYGEVPRAFVVKKDASLNEREIHDLLKDRLSSYKQLRGGIYFVNEITKSPSGKILRRKMREQVVTNSKL
ncbi:Fatty Acid CoA Synthetase family [Aphelenchoides bicaudatus]|nr:Fatty Acid CoA Synthetase family [Aphelenchoides bicaudatus]